jgi:drug/metabolite transporter (DMT)-like permease
MHAEPSGAIVHGVTARSHAQGMRKGGGAVPWVLLATGCYALMDSAVRFVGAQAQPSLVLVVRFAVALIVTLAWLALRPTPTSHSMLLHGLPSQVLRGLALVGTAALGVHAVRLMPVAEYTAVVSLTPLLVTLVAAQVLRHHVTLLQWLLVIGGLIGALIVIRPGSGLFGVGAALAVCVPLLGTVYLAINNHLGAREDPVVTHLHVAWVGLALALAWWVGIDAAAWPSMTAREAAWLLTTGVLATVAQFAVITALGRAPAATLMPFQYAQIAWAALFGWWVLGDLPDAWGWVGMIVIAACGATSAWFSGSKAD